MFNLMQDRGSAGVKLIAMPRNKSGSGQPPAKQDSPDSDAHDAAGNGWPTCARTSWRAARTYSLRSNQPESQHRRPLCVGPRGACQRPRAARRKTSDAIIAPLEPPTASVAPPPPMEPGLTAPRVPPPPARRSSAGIALGVVLVVVGLFLPRRTGRWGRSQLFRWPLVMIIPGRRCRSSGSSASARAPRYRAAS